MNMCHILIMLVLAIFAGCQSANTDPFAYLNDPVARATGVRWGWEQGKHYDAGVILFRERTSNFARDQGTTDLRMAFDVNNHPVQIGGAELNGVLLPWIATEQPLFHAQIYAKANQIAGYGAADSATFSYVGYDGESWTTTIEAAPDFGDIISPDTIIMSQGLTIKYAKAISGDSIHVSIFEELKDAAYEKTLPTDSIAFDKWLPDTGTIMIPPFLLPHVQGVDFYIIQVYRFHFTERTSPKGKVIGIFSQELFPPYDYSAKP